MTLRTILVTSCLIAIPAFVIHAQTKADAPVFKTARAPGELTNKDIWASPLFSAESVGGLASMNDGLHYTVQEDDGGETVVNQYAYRTGEKVATLVRAKELVPAGSKEPVEMDGYSFSGDEKKMMIETGSEPIYRYSYYAYNHVFDRASKKLVPLADVKKAKQRLATFSPDGSMAAFVRDNNLFVVDLATMTETAVTTDGEWNKVLNGATDWVYEEEFTLVQGYAWSPDGKKLLYLRSDESKVKEFDLILYKEQLYPGEYRFKYPKAGEENSKVQLFVYEIPTKNTRAIPLGADGDIYVARLGWRTNDVLWFMRLNRLQNEKTIASVNLAERSVPPVVNTLYQEKSKTYVEVTDDLHFLEDGAFVLTSEKDGWNHIYLHREGTQPLQLTRGGWDVVAVMGVDEKNKRVIFTAAKSAPENQDVLAVPLNGKGVLPLSPEGGYNDAEFSKGFQFFINTRSTRNTVPVYTLHDGNGKLVKVLKDNAKLGKNCEDHGVMPSEFFQFTTEGGVELRGWMMKPRGFRPERKYPVFMTQYSGPNSNEVTDHWGGRNQLWYAMLAQKGYLVVCVDPRGTGHRGHDFRHITYGQLGKYEVEDQIAAAKWLGQQAYVNKDRIGIWGWSYGGYMSSLCITKGADVFKTAIAVAPVTNWRYYDSIYTERYMGLPQDNAQGYDDNSPVSHVNLLTGKYFLIHGLADDNVHYQNSAEMTNALVRANKPFDQFVYPDRNHGIYGGSTRLHLFEMMTEWVLKNL
ncbi:MAG: S9 family peptidase [Flavobacteriales bacterium]|nr:S9 family peptidase [Flavobacteriales bacterium]MCC6938637.1 S9 family peptidase [Flavobacteriales bacterium]